MMRNYSYSALDELGVETKGRLKAAHLTSALSTLSSKEYSDVKIERSRFLGLRLRSGSKVPKHEVLHFTRQLATFADAGMSMVSAIDGLQAETSSDPLSVVLLDVTQRLRSGERFADAFAAHPGVFPESYSMALRSAELTGQIGVVLHQLADYMERDLAAKRKVRAALVYPSIVMVMAIVAVLVLTLFSLPRFASFFGSLGGAEMPLPARMLLGLSDLVEMSWPFLVALLIVVPVGSFMFLRTPRGVRFRDRMALRIPVVRDVVNAVVLERFCYVFGAMLAAGVPVYESLEIAGDASNNTVYKDALKVARDAILRGEGLAGPIARTDMFPSHLCQMLRVGEDSGDVVTQLEAAGKYYTREVGYKIDRLTSLFEPAILLVMGAVVGFVAVAMVSAMYGMFTQIEGF